MDSSFVIRRFRAIVCWLWWLGALASSASAATPASGDALWSDSLATAATFQAGEGAGSLVKMDGRTVLQVSRTEAKASALRTIDVPVGQLRGRRVYLSAEVKAAELSAKPQDWNGVKVMLEIDTPEGTQWPQLALPSNEFGWKQFSTRILIPADATKLTLHLGLELVSGTAWFANVRIMPAGNASTVPAAPANQSIFKGHSVPTLRGAMVHPEMKREDLRVFAQDWGGNLIRWQLLYIPRRGEERDPAAYDRWLDQALAKLDNVLKWAKEYGVRVVVDLHSPPGGRVDHAGSVAVAAGDFWSTSASQEHYLKVWQRIATRYKDERSVIWGFDLLNEPDDRTVTAGCDDWQALVAKAAAAVRAIDPQRTLIVEPNGWGSADGFEGFEPIPFARVVYSFHLYTPIEYTHQGVFGPSGPVVYPGVIAEKRWNRAALEESVAPAVAFASKYRVQMYVGEFSAIRWAPGAETYLTDAMALFESHGWDWSYHAYREWQGWNLELGTDRNDLTPTKTPGARMKAVLYWLHQNQHAR